MPSPKVPTRITAKPVKQLNQLNQLNQLIVTAPNTIGIDIIPVNPDGDPATAAEYVNLLFQLTISAYYFSLLLQLNTSAPSARSMSCKLGQSHLKFPDNPGSMPCWYRNCYSPDYWQTGAIAMPG